MFFYSGKQQLLSKQTFAAHFDLYSAVNGAAASCHKTHVAMEI